MPLHEKTNPFIGHRLRSLRKTQKLSQEELADRLGISPNYLGELERGVRKPSLRISEQICEYFQVTLDYFIRGTEYRPAAHVVRETDPRQTLSLLVRQLTETEARVCLEFCRLLVNSRNGGFNASESKSR